MPAFIDAQGQTHQVPVDVTMYRQAADRGMSLQAHLNSIYPTNVERDGSAFQQMLASEGIYVKANREVGIQPTTMYEMMNGRPEVQGATVVKDAVPASRILFPAVFLQAIEDKLVQNLSMTATAFEEMIAVDESINGDRYEQPIINYSKPEAAMSQGISQLAQPASMMTITTSDKAYRIPTFALGMEISDQALKASTLDFVALSMARQAAVERNTRAQNYVLALLQGDVDNNDSSLAALGYSTATNTLDAACVAGTVSHKAWMKYLMLNGTKRTLTHIVTDFDTAYKVETRSGKPTVTGDDSNTSRIDTQFQLMNPTWARNPKIFLTQDTNWPASTIMGLDKQWAIRRVRNLSASYQGIEAYVLRRSTALRVDFAESINRLYPEAFQVMTVA